MKKIKFCLCLTAILFPALLAQAQSVNLRGNIEKANFQMTLTRTGDKLSGNYFYEKQGSAAKLNVSGSIDAGGNFTLNETDATGRSTGVFKGKWNEDKDAGVLLVEGIWQKPGGKELTFYAEQQNVYLNGNLSITSRKIAENNKAKLFEIDAEYPEITGGASPGIAGFNTLAKQTVTKSLAVFRKDMLQQTAEDLKFSKERGISNYTEISYSVEYADDNFVSLFFSNNSYEGGAHPNHSSYTINYDLKNNRQLALGDLFLPKSNYLKMISDLSIAQLKSDTQDMTDDEWLKNGAGPKAENFSSWNLTGKGLTINFDPYQVAAYAAGPQTVFIPVEKLKEILKPNGITANLKK